MVCTQVCAASTFQRISAPCGSGGCRMVPKASQYSTDFRLFVRMCVQIFTCTGSSGASRRGDRAVRPAATHMPMRWSRRRRRGSDRHGRSWARPTVQPQTLQYKQMCEDACLLSEAATGEWHRQLLCGMKFEGKHTSPRRDRRRSSAAPVAAPLLSPPACRQSSALAAAASLPFASGGCSGLNPAAGCCSCSASAASGSSMLIELLRPPCSSACWTPFACGWAPLRQSDDSSAPPDAACASLDTGVAASAG